MATAKASKLSDHWQLNKSLCECNFHMLENEFNDVTFELSYECGAEQKEPVYVPALQTLLLARSPVFQGMFAGALAQKKIEPQVIPVTDIEPEAFKEMLRFIYTDEVELTADNVMAVLYASKKYIVTNLTKQCIRFIEEMLSAEIASQVLDHSMFFDEKELKNKVLDKIKEDASAVLLSEDFTKLSKDALREVLQLNLKITKELEVFEAALRWAQNKCKEMEKSAEGANLREALGENIFLVRFPTMTVDDFNDVVLPSDVLNESEGFKVLRYITSKTRPDDLPFSTEPRDFQSQPTALAQSLPDVMDTRLLEVQGPYDTTSVRFYRGLGQPHEYVTTLECSVSRPIRLRKLLVHCPDHTRLTYKLTIEVSPRGYGPCFQSRQQDPLTFTAPGMPRHAVVDLRGVRVGAGELRLLIYIEDMYVKSLAKTYLFSTLCDVSFSNATTSRLRDDYVSLTFPPVSKNLLLGIEYYTDE